MDKRVKEWIKFAKEDLKTAKLTFKEKIYNQTCFHAQQCPPHFLRIITSVPIIILLFYFTNSLHAGWNKADLSSGSSWMSGVSVGNGRNDGIMRVYAACDDNHIYEFSYSGQDSNTGGGLENAFCYPSPARLSQGQVINFKGFTSFAEVKILSPAGHILKTLKADQNGNIPPWDGQTDSSGKIASGVYVVHASDEKENLKIFKIMIIK